MNTDGLALYHYDGCLYCARVRSAMRALGVEIELRNIHQDAQHLADLTEARGRTTVPVLRIGDEWMGESADIVQYLADRFGDGTVPGNSSLAMAWRLTPLAMLVAGAFAAGAVQAGLWSGGCLLLGIRAVQSATRDRSVVDAVRGVALFAAVVFVAMRELG